MAGSVQGDGLEPLDIVLRAAPLLVGWTLLMFALAPAEGCFAFVMVCEGFYLKY
jgi:hypothetical protein